MSLIDIVIGMIAGMCIGAGLTSCLVAAKREDVRLIMCQINIGKLICFVDQHGRELFHLPDGDSIQLISDGGDQQVSVCHYVDDAHVEVDGVRWEIQAFAKRMARNGIDFYPLRR